MQEKTKELIACGGFLGVILSLVIGFTLWFVVLAKTYGECEQDKSTQSVNNPRVGICFTEPD